MDSKSLKKSFINTLIVIQLLFYVSSSDIVIGDYCECDKFIAYEWNCNKYYECASNQLFLRDCPQSLHFNEALQQCVYPSESTCKDDSTCGVNFITTTTSNVITSSSESTTTSVMPPQKCDDTPNCFEKSCSPFEDLMSVSNCR